MINLQKKKNKKRVRLNRYQSAEHGEYTKIYKERLPLDTFEQFMTLSEVELENDQCFESFMGEFLVSLLINNIKNVRKFKSYLSKEMLRNFILHYVNVF